MARRSRKAVTQTAPTDSEISEALASGDDETIIETAQRQAAADLALAAALKARDGAQAPEAPRGQTLGEQFEEIVHLIARLRRDTRLSETGLIKLWELNLMWVLNNRHQPQPQPQFSYDDLPGSGEEMTGEAIDLPVANEVLDGSEESSSEEAN